MNTVRFNDAMLRIASVLTQHPVVRATGLENYVVVRDLYGRIRLLCPQLTTDQAADLERSWIEALGSSSDVKKPLWSDSDFFDSAKLRYHQDLKHLTLGEGKVAFLDRGIIASDWLEESFEEVALPEGQAAPKRVVFYGLKGGVGRSTALCLAARHFAKKGLKVLVLDMDLESPGLSSLLLPEALLPDYGIVDWFVEDALQQADSRLLESMTAESPLSSEWSGSIRVAPALGKNESDYIPKLARIYAPTRLNDGAPPQNFADRFFRMLRAIESLLQPDVVLLDSRAGLHDIAATLLVRVPDALRLLFATDSPQTWLGYKQLFKHWQAFPEHISSFRSGLQIVDALMPDTGVQEHLKSFLENSYSLFSETIYDVAPPSIDTTELFSFALGDGEAPHSGPPISWDRKFMEFDPNDSTSPFHSNDLVRACYGAFLDCLDERLGYDPQRRQ